LSSKLVDRINDHDVGLTDELFGIIAARKLAR
jgi:hypothetical protein